MATQEIQKEAEVVLSEKIYPLFAAKHVNLLMSEKEVKEFWKRRTYRIRPHSYSYIFSYQEHCITHARGFNLLDGGYKYNLEPGPDIRGYISHLIPEQQYLNVYEIRRVVIDIFNKYADFFLTYPGEYALKSDIIIKDHNDKLWNACQVIEPLVYNEKMNLVKYFCTVSLGSKTDYMPFQSKLIHATEKGDLKQLQKFAIIMRGIKKEEAKHLGFSKTYMKYFRQYSKGFTSEKIAEINGHKNDNAWRQARTRTNALLKEIFPILMNQYSHTYNISDDSEKHVSALNTTITAKILNQTGFIYLD